MRSHAEAMEVGAQLSKARDELETSRREASEYKAELETLSIQLNDANEALVRHDGSSLVVVCRAVLCRASFLRAQCCCSRRPPPTDTDPPPRLRQSSASQDVTRSKEGLAKQLEAERERGNYLDERLHAATAEIESLKEKCSRHTLVNRDGSAEILRMQMAMEEAQADIKHHESLAEKRLSEINEKDQKLEEAMRVAQVLRSEARSTKVETEAAQTELSKRIEELSREKNESEASARESAFHAGVQSTTSNSPRLRLLPPPGEQERQITSLKRELEATTKAQKEANAAAEEERAMRRAAERRAIDSNTEDSGYAKALEEAHQERDRALSKLSGAQTKVASLDTDLRAAKRTSEQHLTETRRLEALLAKERKERIATAESDSTAGGSSETKVARANKEELDSALSKITSLQRSLDAKARSLDEVQAELAELREAREQEANQDRASSQAQEEIASLREELGAARKEVVEAQARSMRTASSEDLPPVIEEEETKRVEELTQKLATAQEESAALSSDLERERSALEELRREQGGEQDELRVRTESLQKALAEAKKEGNEAKDALTSEAKAWAETEASLRSDIAKAERARKVLES